MPCRTAVDLLASLVLCVIPASLDHSAPNRGIFLMDFDRPDNSGPSVQADPIR